MRSRGATLRTASLRLAGLAHHRFALPALADLHAAHGAKVVSLAARLGASRDAARRTLEALAERGLARRNPGYGHPMRPEWILTAAGERLAVAGASLLGALREARVEAVARRKWALPVLHALLARERRFSGLARDLPGVTDRALAAALRGLEEAGAVSRRVVHDRPPRVVYAPAARVRPLRRAIARLADLTPGPTRGRTPGDST